MATGPGAPAPRDNDVCTGFKCTCPQGQGRLPQVQRRLHQVQRRLHPVQVNLSQGTEAFAPGTGALAPGAKTFVPGASEAVPRDRDVCPRYKRPCPAGQRRLPMIRVHLFPRERADCTRRKCTRPTVPARRPCAPPYRSGPSGQWPRGAVGWRRGPAAGSELGAGSVAAAGLDPAHHLAAVRGSAAALPAADRAAPRRRTS